MWTAVGPVLCILAVVIALVMASGCVRSLVPEPVRSKTDLVTGILTFLVAGYCFARGLKNEHDYLRMWHGLWHLLVCVPSFYLWQIHSPKPYYLREMFHELRSAGVK